MQKALRGLETGLDGFNRVTELENVSREKITASLSQRTPDRILKIAQAFREDFTVEEINQITGFDPWFLRQIEAIVEAEKRVADIGLPREAADLRKLKALGFSDAQLARDELMRVYDARREERAVRIARRLGDAHYAVVAHAVGRRRRVRDMDEAGALGARRHARRAADARVAAAAAAASYAAEGALEQLVHGEAARVEETESTLSAQMRAAMSAVRCFHGGGSQGVVRM